MARLKKDFLLTIFVPYFILNCSSTLVVNVRTKRGDITQEEIDADPEKDLITLNYKLNNGQYVDMLIDFPKVWFV